MSCKTLCRLFLSPEMNLLVQPKARMETFVRIKTLWGRMEEA